MISYEKGYLEKQNQDNEDRKITFTGNCMEEVTVD